MNSTSPTLKRVKRKIKRCQNPLFEKWLREWKEEARQNGSEMQHCFNRALKSLQKFPFRLKTGKECLMLENFGLKICQMLDKKLEEHKASHIRDVDPVGKNCGIINHIDEQKNKKRKSTETSSNKIITIATPDLHSVTAFSTDYLPAEKSGPYAILIALLEKSQEDNFKGFLTKAEILDCAQKYCDSSFIVPKIGSYCTAWSGMKVLLQKQLVEKRGNLAKFSLTERGTDLAIKIKFSLNKSRKSNINIEENLGMSLNKKPKTSKKNVGTSYEAETKELKTSSTQKKYLSPSKTVLPDHRVLSQSSKFIKSSGVSQVENFTESPDDVETIFMLPNSFKVILLVDNQERDNKFQQSDQMTMSQLKTRNVDFEIRHLKVGDFLWIARNDIGQELVLPYIVERKRMDDLASSIKDGRFHEQKFRLKQSKVENLIYLVEKYGNESQRLGLPLPTLMQAISNTQIISEFNVRITRDHNHSMRYLDIMTTQLNNIFKRKTLLSCKKSDVKNVNLSEDILSLMTFKDFNKGSEKNKKPTIRNMLIKHLLQLNGLSVEKAKAIVHLFPTPKILIEALKGSEGEKDIAKLTYGSFNRSIGPVTAKQLRMLYTLQELS